MARHECNFSACGKAEVVTGTVHMIKEDKKHKAQVIWLDTRRIMVTTLSKSAAVERSKV